MEEVGGDLLGALHAVEHALISVLPLLAMCDRWDIGGLSTNIHPQTLRPTVFVYDGHAGGVGIAQRGHDRFAELVASAARVVVDCRCRDGCPSCVQSPKCGNLNEMLDKHAAARLLQAMTEAASRGGRTCAGSPDVGRVCPSRGLARDSRGSDPAVSGPVHRRSHPHAQGVCGLPRLPRRLMASARSMARRRVTNLACLEVFGDGGNAVPDVATRGQARNRGSDPGFRGSDPGFPRSRL